MSKAKELLVTSGKQMREGREQGVVLPFPSGNNYRVRIIGADGLLKRGNLPNPLQAFAADAFYAGVTEDKYDAFMSPKQDDGAVLGFVESLATVCEAMFMEPRVVADPQGDDEIMAEDLPLTDRMWAFRLAFAPAETLYPFRRQQRDDVESVHETQDSAQATK